MWTLFRPHRIVDEQRGKHRDFVFTYKGERLFNMLNSAWRKARVRAGSPRFRVHDLRHTFGHRLRAAGVNFEDRQDLLGHKSERITTHYSAPDIARLLEAAERVCERRPKYGIAGRSSHESHTIAYTKRQWSS